ncbi:hypothetical protein N7540_010192 [Penicillium herquei]|nr:hypothetical protein N7540_010192 [Penicillium herquei]
MDSTVIVDAGALSPWNTADVGYFYPDNDSLKHIETEDNHTLIFHNAEAFVSHLRGIAVFKTEYSYWQIFGTELPTMWW